MSLLTPLYILGILAVAAPIVFHLIRRSPRGEVPFSSLMFLSPTPPRLTRRSRLDQILLLILRASALCLLALAFTRPFLREAVHLNFGDPQGRRIALLIDTSASMRRGNVWLRAQAIAKEVISSCGPGDQLALFSFDGSSQPLLSFEESATLDPAKRQAIAQTRLARLAPTWGATNLGQALIDTVAAIEDMADKNEKTGRMPRRVVLVSDLQQGSRLDALGDFEWPSDVELDLKTVTETGSNAGLQALAESAEGEAAEAGAPLRVRVSNDAGSRQEKFALRWVDQKGAVTGKPLDAYVPPGESRVVRVPRPAGGSLLRSLKLEGDTYAFDNTLYFADQPREDATILYVGADSADDPAGLLYYLERVFSDTPKRSVHIVAILPSAALGQAPARSCDLVVLAGETSTQNAARLQKHMSDGATLLYVATEPKRDQTLAALAGVSAVDLAEADLKRDVMLGEIAFDNPLFAPLAGAQFNDFTKIHFWKYRHIDPGALGDARVVARFENGDPAILEKTVGKGMLVVLASGWQPADSQLARSSKFVPLMSALLEGRTVQPFDATSHLVDERVRLPAMTDAGKGVIVHKPDGTLVVDTPKSAYFSETDTPGVYTIDTAAGPRSFAVNLDPLESKTSPLHVETLEQFGCRLASHARKNADREHLQQMHNAELENRQKFWRWLILAATGVLIVETWLAGRLSRPRPAQEEAVP